MFIFRLISAFVLLLLVGACGSSPTSSTSPSPTAAGRTPVLVGLDWHQNGPSTVVVMRLDGSIISTRTLPATWLVDEHAVGAYMLVANDGSGKGWTVDATGNVAEVAPAAAAFLSPPADGSGWTPPLIVDSTTAVTVGFKNDTVTAYEVNLRTGKAKSLLTAPQSHSIGPVPLTVLDVSPDRNTVWLRKVTAGASGGLEIVGIDLKTGTVTMQGKADAFLGEVDVAISPDGKLVAAQEEAGVDSTNLAIRHLHVLTLGSQVDSDVQGAAPYTGGQRSPSVLFAPGGASVAWWGGIDNGDNTFAVNVAPVGGAGRGLYQLDTNPQMTHMVESVYWVDSGTLVVQTDSTTTPGVFRGEGLHAFTIDATTGAKRPLPDSIRYVVAVLT